MSGPHHIVGLSLFGPLVLTVATAPANRVRLLLQTQDEIVLNLREESLAHHRHHTSSSSSSNIKPYNVTANSNTAQDEEEDDEEPRSIIAPYAQLPYTDIQDCYTRLLEKEGRSALWRGYSVEVGRIFLQKSLETRLTRKGTFGLRRWMSLTPPNVQGGGMGAGWMLATAVEGTLVGAAAMAVVYPLAVLHAKMATDVVRRTRIVRKVVSKRAPSHSPVAVQEVKDGEAPAAVKLSSLSSTESISRDSVEWVDHTSEWAYQAQEQDQDQGQKQEDPMVSTPVLEGPLSVSEPKNIPDESTSTAVATLEEDDTEYSYTTVTYDLSHKYKTYRQIFNEIIASSEGYLGLYKGFSTVVASAFISRLGMMTIYTIKSFCAGPSGTVAFSPFQVFLTQTALSVVTYPLTTVGNRRMIAHSGRYTSSWDAAKQIVEKQGWQALFRGVEVVVLRSVALAALSQLLL